MNFFKMHGLGNDFIVTHGYSDDQIAAWRDRFPLLCDRRKGIGADGIIFVLPAQAGGDFRMRIFNADGSEPEMCGNGIRCFARYVARLGLSPRRRLAVETAAGLIYTTLDDSLVTVDMGKPILAAERIPTAQTGGRVLDYPLALDDRTVTLTAVSMGNPHAVIFGETLSDSLVEETAPKLQRHPFFPNSVNVEFVQVVSRREARVRVYERGCGETPACGTGACAVVVAGILTDRLDNAVTVHLPGGDLQIRWDGVEEHAVFKTGAAAMVYRAECYLLP